MTRRHDGFSEMERWDPLGFQADGDGLWMRSLDARPRQFVAIRFTDMAEHISEREMAESGCARFDVNVLLVDLDAIGESGIQSALRSCGWDEMPEAGEPLHGRALAECCVRYGAHAPIGGDAGNNLRKVLRTARREANGLMADADALAHKLAQPVNALGSTAAEFMRGDMDAAMSRGLAEGNTNARICAQMHRPLPDGAVSAQVDLQAIPSDDPLAYFSGFMDGFKGSEMAGPVDDLADAYFDGRKVGADVRMGRSECPGWVR